MICPIAIDSILTCTILFCFCQNKNQNKSVFLLTGQSTIAKPKQNTKSCRSDSIHLNNTFAGVMAAKKTSELIALCHQIALDQVDVHCSLDEEKCCVNVECTASCHHRTGVEMEALTGASVAALTVYDMCKALSKEMVIENVRLLRKSGGKSGDYVAGTEHSSH